MALLIYIPTNSVWEFSQDFYRGVSRVKGSARNVAATRAHGYAVARVLSPPWRGTVLLPEPR
jgi:hypothetical protein